MNRNVRLIVVSTLFIAMTMLPAPATARGSGTKRRCNGTGARDAACDVPNVDFSIATHKKVGARVTQAVHLFKLYCAAGGCALDRLVLNECDPPGSRTATFQPKLDTWATWAGTLEVKRIGDGVVEALARKYFDGDPQAGTTLRFTYEPVQ